MRRITSQSLPLPLLLLCSAISAFACTAEEQLPVDMGERADDLIGMTVRIHPGDVRIVSVPSYESVEFAVDEGWSTIDIYTDDLRLDVEFADLVVKVKSNQRGDAGDFAAAFLIQSRSSEEAQWTNLQPVSGNGGYFWERASATRDGDVLTLSGRAIRVEDVNWGTTRSFSTKNVTQRIESASDKEFRFLLIPTWNFWDWDSSGYDAKIQFARL